MGALAVLTVLSHSLLSDAIFLGQRRSDTSSLMVKFHEDVDYKVVKKESIHRNSSTDCLCELGSFWHWRIKKCVKQGGWGYECGFFPAEHHNKVCQDGLKCELLNKTGVKYIHPGAVPASCQACEAEDKCLMGKERHSQNCLKEYKLVGSACQTVEVTTMATAHAKVTEEVSKSGTASATATATASQKAKVEEAGQTASATKEATAEGKATAKVEESAKASAKAKATEEGKAEGKACVTVEEVKALLDLQDVKSIGAVLSAQVLSRGDEEAFDKAYAKALDAATKAGMINAKQAAEALASGLAREKATLEAKAKADEAAAWKAEAGAEKDAQDNAKAEALAKAEAAASAEAVAAAKAAAEAGDAAAQAALDADAAAKAAGAGGAGGSMSKEDAAAAKAKAEAAQAKAAAAQKKADEAKKAAAEAKARQDALADVMNPTPTGAPQMRPTKAPPTSPPRKITPEQIAAQNP
jgi:hypothetical protein